VHDLLYFGLAHDCVGTVYTRVDPGECEVTAFLAHGCLDYTMAKTGSAAAAPVRRLSAAAALRHCPATSQRSIQRSHSWSACAAMPIQQLRLDVSNLLCCLHGCMMGRRYN
jgi:hypothetical protein